MRPSNSLDGLKMAKNEEKSCPEIFTSQKLKFSAKLVKENAMFDDFFWLGFFFRFCKKIAANSLFFAKNENVKKMQTILTQQHCSNQCKLYYNSLGRLKTR